MTTLIETEKSALIMHDMSDEMEMLIATCCEICDEELDVNPEIKIFGKPCHQHRSIGFYSNDSEGYFYSGQLAASKPLHPCMRELMDNINERFESDFNGILINKYASGEDYIGKHSDNEKALNPKVGVLMVSHGAVRKFRIRNKETNEIVMDVPTEQNKILQMAGNFQKEFTHEIPVEKRVKGARYSLTFRKHTK